MPTRARPLDIPRPLVLAPMAGGPSTPSLCVAVCEAGGLGFLAAGYLTPDALADHIADVQAATSAAFGVNVFVPSPPPQGAEADTARAAYTAFRERLEADGLVPEAGLPPEPKYDDDAFDAKLDVVIDARVPVVSFTFGLPPSTAVERLHEAGMFVAINCTSSAGIRAAHEAGADVIGLQGPGAGGHRAAVVGLEDGTATASPEQLLAEAQAITDRPLIAAGGVRNAADVRRLLEAGASAVQVGTLFLTTTEAGTRPTHREALLTLRDRPTRLTRAFSGRPARTIDNEFVRAYDDLAPGLYPQVHHLTSPVRAAANERGDAEHLNLWAGTGFTACRECTAAELVANLTEGTD